nr:MAG TPA: hypothetical protein [Caudoviricetes sp.]
MIVYELVFRRRIDKSLIDPVFQRLIYALCFYSVSTRYVEIKRPFYF